MSVKVVEVKRKDGFVYHRRFRVLSKIFSKTMANCSFQGLRLPLSMGLRCPECGVGLRTRVGSDYTESARKKGSLRTSLHMFSRFPKVSHWRQRRVYSNILYLIERVPEIREQISNLQTGYAFRGLEKSQRCKG